MAEAKNITIVGGGLAGLTLGIALRQKQVPVTIHEAGVYPRHRVCGEFISGRGQTVLERLGLMNLLNETGVFRARTVAFYSAKQGTPACQLPSSALCISRYSLDAALASEFHRLGGEMISGCRWRDRDFGEGIVRATGRVAAREPKATRWFGLKMHVRNVSLAADLEMHFSRSGYVGLCKINDDEVNVCGLFRKGLKEPGTAKNGRELLAGGMGRALNQRLATAMFDEESFCAVAGLSLKPQRAFAHREVCIGDAITMIPPVTGNGMSMAFESAELAGGPLIAWSRGEASWMEARRKIASACDATFGRRLAWAKWLQRGLLMPALQDVLLKMPVQNRRVWEWAFNATR